MRKYIIVFLLAVLLVADVNSQQKRKKKVRHEKKKEFPISGLEDTERDQSQTDVFQMLETDEAAEVARAQLEAKLKILQENEAAEENEVDSFRPDEEIPSDPCFEKRCGPGRECIPTLQGKARCVCMKNCPSEDDNRRRVCSNYNETWASDCELYRSRCMCDEAAEECDNPLNKHLHIDYYGECREMPVCAEEEMGDFPRRMRDWLFNVMREMADRRELSPHFLQMEREAERSSNDSRRSVVAAIWKWCDLDGHPHDRIVSRHELFPIRAPLMALEHCIAPFLDNCDADNDHRITLKEWGYCLQVPSDEMEDKCDDVRGANESADEGDEEA